EAGNGIAQRGATAVRHVQRAGRVRGDELDLDPATLAGGAPPERPVRGNDLGEPRLQDRVGEPEVDEPRAGDLGGGHAGAAQVEALDDALRNGTRRLAEAGGQHECHVRGQVPVLRIARALELEVQVRGAAQLEHDPVQLLTQRVRVHLVRRRRAALARVRGAPGLPTAFAV